jgi:hypothetical protein
MFQRGVEYLLKTQVIDPVEANGMWKAVHTQSQRKSDFAPTMWAVIGLAGSYGTEPKGALQVVREGDKIAAHNLEIVLDVSGSMNAKLGETTRWQTALATLKEVGRGAAGRPQRGPARLRAPLFVEVRRDLPGHGARRSDRASGSPEDRRCRIGAQAARRDPAHTVRAENGRRPESRRWRLRHPHYGWRGELQRQCQVGGRPDQVLWVHVGLNIVGFTLTGKAVESELAGLAARPAAVTTARRTARSCRAQ